MRLIIGYPPGGSADITARLIGQWLSERLGQPFVVESRPGAGTNLATEAVVRAPPDGYTLLLVAPANAINATLYDKLNFNFMRDIAPVAGLIRFPNVVVVNPSVPVKTIPEFIAYAKANPGKLNMASSGNGSTIHMSGELFKMMTGINMVHVPYRGGALALTDLIAGQVQVMFDNVPTSVEHIRAGKLRGAGGDQRDALGRAAGPADGGRCPARLRGERVVRPGRAEGHARRDHRAAQQGDQRDPRRSQGEGAASPSSAPRCCRARPPTSASSSPTKPRSGARWSSSRASRRTRSRAAGAAKSPPAARNLPPAPMWWHSNVRGRRFQASIPGLEPGSRQ